MAGSFPVNIDVLDLRQNMDAGEAYKFLDVRQPWEVGVCSFDGSINVPLMNLPGHVDKLPKDEAVVVVCHHGVRSQQAVAWLRAQGFTNMINLQGGINAWAQRVDQTMATY